MVTHSLLLVTRRDRGNDGRSRVCPPEWIYTSNYTHATTKKIPEKHAVCGNRTSGRPFLTAGFFSWDKDSILLIHAGGEGYSNLAGRHARATAGSPAREWLTVCSVAFGAGEPFEGAAQDIFAVPWLADAVALAGIDQHLRHYAARLQRLVERLAHRQRTAPVVARVQDQGRRADIASVGERTVLTHRRVYLPRPAAELPLGPALQIAQRPHH